MRFRLFIVAVASIAIAVIMAILLSANMADAETVRCSTQATNNKNDIIHFSTEYNIQSDFTVRIDPSSDTSTYTQEGFWQSGSIFHYDTALVAPSPNTAISIIQTGGSFRRSSCSMWVNWVEPAINQGPSPGVAYWPVDEETKALMRQWAADSHQTGIEAAGAGVAWGNAFAACGLATGNLLCGWFAIYGTLFGGISYISYRFEDHYNALAKDPDDWDYCTSSSPQFQSADAWGLGYTGWWVNDGIVSEALAIDGYLQAAYDNANKMGTAARAGDSGCFNARQSDTYWSLYYAGAEMENYVGYLQAFAQDIYDRMGNGDPYADWLVSQASAIYNQGEGLKR